ncbi:MAG TPA: amidohydrolase family protein [Bacteroidota bacterium]|nr:amidohydrolase family protein [Bacteroidota bacterium]
MKKKVYRRQETEFRRVMHAFTILLSSLLIVDCSLFASDPIPAKKQDHPIALVGATIHPVTGPEVPNGIILFDAGKITGLGAQVSLPSNVEKIDVSGKHIYPGLINANSTVGLTEIEAVRATNDFAETGRINPNVRSEIAINPESELIPVARANGVVIMNVMPQGGLIAGRSAAIMMDGWTQEDVILKAPIGMVVNWPPMSVSHSPWVRQTEEEQKKDHAKQLKDLDDAFADARAYMVAKKAESGKDVPHHPIDVRWEAMIPVLERTVPVLVIADELRQIEAAVQWSKDQNVKLIIVGGRDAWRTADLLKSNDIPVIVGPTLDEPNREWEPYDDAFTVPAKLYSAGVRFAISGEGEAMAERNTPYHAAMAAAYGLPKEEALKAVTIYPARILGIDARAGSLEIGKDATLIVTNGDPLEIESNVLMEFIQGKKIDLRSRHTVLYDKYREKYKQSGVLK